MEFSFVSIPGSRLLIVDDEPVLALTLAIVLRKAGATVLTAANGQEALDVLAREPIDAMLCDQRMPVMDGPTLLRTLARREQTLPTVLFVNGVDREDSATLELWNVRRVVKKPLQPIALLETFDSLLAEIRESTTVRNGSLHSRGNVDSKPV